jgi:3-oxoacyl-[acyl-carrier-protein] synthase II
VSAPGGSLGDGSPPRWRRPISVGGVGALCGFGVGWRGLAAFVRRGTRPPAPEVPPLGAGDEPCEPRQRKLMSRAAYLGAAAIGLALRDLDGAGRGADADVEADGRSEPGVGLFMGVGASGGDLAELEAMLGASVEGGQFDWGRFGGAGLLAANPLFAFQLMNNFTLCHGAILSGLQGPNGAFFSRGAGTVTALREAAFAVAAGEAAVALAGGADSALHPVTAAELARGGWIARGLAPAEGAALIALAAPASAPPPAGARGVSLVRAEVRVARDGDLATIAAAALAAGPPAGPDAIVLCPWGEPARAALVAAAARAAAPDTEILDAGAALGESLAAAPALGWAVARDWLDEPRHERGRVLVLSAGIDGELGLVELAGGAVT